MKVLVLAGTAEARALCAQLADMPEIAAVASLAGVTATPEPYAVPVRTGGFGGATGLAAALRDGGFQALIDATHPFAVEISANAARAAKISGVPLLRLVRPSWPDAPTWQHAATLKAALAMLPRGSTAFLATGAKSLADLSEFGGRACYLRVVDAPSVPFPGRGGFVVGKPPFTVAGECALFTRLGITHLVLRNSGGDLGRAKLDAAARMGIQVVMIDRPATEPASRVETPQAARDWLASVAFG